MSTTANAGESTKAQEKLKPKKRHEQIVELRQKASQPGFPGDDRERLRPKRTAGRHGARGNAETRPASSAQYRQEMPGQSVNNDVNSKDAFIDDDHA